MSYIVGLDNYLNFSLRIKTRRIWFQLFLFTWFPKKFSSLLISGFHLNVNLTVCNVKVSGVTPDTLM